MARKSKELEALKAMFSEEDRISEEELIQMEGQESFIAYFQEQASYLSDDRFIEHTLHSIDSILLVVIFGIMAYCNTFLEIYNFMIKRQEWLTKHIKFDCGLPSLSTIKRVIGIINPRELEDLCTNVLNTFLVKNEEYYKDKDIVIKDIKSMDGKTANSSDRKSSINGEIKKMNAMSIVSVKNDFCEATEFIDIDKTNEIPTGPKLLNRVKVKNCVIVFDAMSTQEDTIKEIVGKEGYYIAPVKGNQATLEEDIKLFFKDLKDYEQKENRVVRKLNYAM